MSAFDKVLMKIKGRSHDNGHAAINIKNITALKTAKMEIEEMLGAVKK